MSETPRYVIITPGYNEQDYIEYPLKSIVRQTVRPSSWVMVDDGSTDKTADIVKNHAQKHAFIQYYYRRKPEGQDYFASNVFAIMEGWQQIKDLEFDYLAILDADITLPPDYYETIISRMEADPRLGVASGVYENQIDGKLHKVLNDRRSTPKAIMIFRKGVFEQIGGFLPLKYGGEDTAACVMARMHGWKVWSFPDVKVVHHRPTGVGNAGNIVKVRLNQGRAEWAIGSNWLFVFIKCLKRTFREKPYVLSGLLRWIGFLQGCFSGEKRVVSDDFVAYFRKEQLGRVFRFNQVDDCHSDRQCVTNG